MEEVEVALKNMKNGKRDGKEGIVTKLMTYADRKTQQVLTNIYTDCLKCRIEIILIHKKSVGHFIPQSSTKIPKKPREPIHMPIHRNPRKRLQKS